MSINQFVEGELRTAFIEAFAVLLASIRTIGGDPGVHAGREIMNRSY